jgi:hypothetical protein
MTEKPGTKFPATHILAYEENSKMVEVLVRLEGASLLTADEWAAHGVPDWTFEDDGRLYYCGVDFVAELGRCTLRTLGRQPIPLDTLELVVRSGQRSVLVIAKVLGFPLEDVVTAIATLARAGKVRREGEDRVVPRF